MDKGTRVEMLAGEYWWGGAVNHGPSMPFHAGSDYEADFNRYHYGNQASPLLLSSKGRSLWSDGPFHLSIQGGVIEIKQAQQPVEVRESSGDLRGAYLAVMQQHFPPSGRLPDPRLFTATQWNTWIEMGNWPTQQKVLDYAQQILDNGLKPGVLMIDSDWMESYGDFHFHSGKFPDPKGMIARLHDLGFQVMVWICPFVRPDGSRIWELLRKGFLLKQADGEASITRWWGGYSAVLDLLNPQAVGWLKDQLDWMMAEYGVDGFKADAGDPDFYHPGMLGASAFTPSDQTEAWARIGLDYPLNEYRATWKQANQPLAQRLRDKFHAWDTEGLATLIPCGIAQGLMGYAYTCPDMIGGGEFSSFEGDFVIDQELFVRYAQCAALFPMMQFSLAPWRVLDPEHLRCCQAAARLHERYGDQILALAHASAQSGEPLIRHLAYQYPGQGYEPVGDQFLLGEDLLVAPVLSKGANHRAVTLPPGVWVGDDGQRLTGPAVIETPAPLERLPFFQRVKEVG